MKFFKQLFFYALFSIALLQAKPPELTATSTRQKIQEILRFHSTYKTINEEVMAKAIDNFLSELDPLRCYWIEPEVSSWLNPSPLFLTHLKECLEREHYTPFQELFTSMKTAIDRREAIEEWVSKQPLEGLESIAIKEKTFAKTEQELKERLLSIRALQLHSMKNLSNEEVELATKRYAKYRQKKSHDLYGHTPQEAEKNLFALIIKSIASALDNHTVYFTPQEASSFLINVQQRLFGIGAQLRDDLNGLSIQRLIDGGPALLSKKINLLDRIIAVDGQTIIGMDMVDAVEMIRGPQGTQVVLTILRAEAGKEEQVFNVAITRDEIVLKESRMTVSQEPCGDGIIGRIHLHSFYQDPTSSSYSDVREAILNFQKNDQLKGLILDLRNNGGGLLPQAVEVASLFLGKGVIASIKDCDGNIQHLRNLKNQKVYWGPLLVLTNRASASASEIVAQTLQDYGRALIVGDDHTFGKGTYQTFTMASSDAYEAVNPSGEYKVTRGMYYTVSGKTPQLSGALADIVVPGITSKFDIGEKFSKHALLPDQIKPQFNDDFSDIPPLYRLRARKYYIKDQEIPSDKLKQLLPQLVQNSNLRIKNNSRYQEFLNLTSTALAQLEEIENEPNDFQLLETFNIMKDLILLTPKPDRK